MKYAIGLALATMLVVLAGGCGGNSYESAMNEHLGYLEDMNEVLADVTDKDSLEAAKPKLEAIVAKGKALAKRMDAMEDPSDEQEAALMEKYGPEMGEQMTALRDNMMRIMQIEGADELESVVGGFGN